MLVLDEIKKNKIYGIIREDNPQKAYEIARAYAEGGIRFIELNSPIEATKLVSKIENIIVVQGGIITTSQAHEAIQAGADIISSPIFQQNLVRFATSNKTFLIPSVTTPNEAYNAWRARMPLIKIYPVAEMGGVEYIRELTKPMPFLNLLPCGFVKLDEIEGYIKAGAFAVGVGRQLYSKSYDDIVKTVREVVEMVR